MKKIIVEHSDGDNSYTLTRDDDAGTAALALKGKITPKLARGLIDDLEPMAEKVKKRGLPRQKQSAALAAPKPHADP